MKKSGEEVLRATSQYQEGRTMMDGVQCETKSQGKHIEHSVITYTGWGKK